MAGIALALLKMKPSFRFRKAKLPPRLFLRYCHTHTDTDTDTNTNTSSDSDLFAEELGPLLTPSPSSVSAHAPTFKSKWKMLDSRSLGFSLSLIPYASRTVIKILQSQGHDAFLVGGCVRDLLLNRIPKDFDVITSANLKQVKNKFHHAYIIGRRFPICMVHLKGSAIEVSSFDTVASGKEKELHSSEMPKGCEEKDLMRWKNSLHRDFTVNSLFYDPFSHKIYDYSNGMTDLKAMKMRTLVPAHSSFKVDCARILRGIRIAARLGFSFARDTEQAIHSLYASVKTLDKARLMMEMNYMLSYGSARSSLLLLKRFKLLEILLPFHAAYLADNSVGQSPLMLMELFSKLDGVVSCDQPCDSDLWVSLLVFHLALVNNPQDALVVWTLSSLLYHGSWEEGVKAAREHSKHQVNFSPEIFNSDDDAADEELARRVSNFALNILESIVALTESKSLRRAMHRYPSSPFSSTVFVSKNAGRNVADIFNVLVDDIKSLNKSKNNYSIDYELLKMGDKSETRFVLGKVIMDTMRGGIALHRPKLLSEKKDNFHAKTFKHETQNHKGVDKHRLEGPVDQLNRQTTKKQKLVKEKLGELLCSHGIANRQLLLKKGVVKDVKELFPIKETTLEQDAKLEIWRSVVQAPKDIPTKATILKMVPSAKQHQTLPRNQILHVLETVPKTGDMHDDQAHEEALSVGENISKVLKSHKAQATTEIVNVLDVCKFFKADEDSKHYSVLESQSSMGAEGRDESRKIKNKVNLSSFFK